MPTTIRETASGKVKHAQEGEVESYLQAGYELADGDDRPTASATKADWVAYATTQGYDESEGLTKDQLVERYG